MRLHDLERELRRRGYQLARCASSHRTCVNACGQRIVIAAHSEHEWITKKALGCTLKVLSREEARIG